MICEKCGQHIIRPNKFLNKKEIIINAGLNYFGVELNYIKIKRRNRERVYPRQIIMFLLRKHTRLSLRRIGELFVNDEKAKPYDHTSVIHSCNSIKDLLFSNEQTRRDLMKIEEMMLK